MNTVLMVCFRRYYKKKIQLLSTNKRDKEVSVFNIEGTTANLSNVKVKVKKLKKVSKLLFLKFIFLYFIQMTIFFFL